ncbi:MAG: prepilin-type N-terminal cleavage/methylation domain-containing protein [Candidatus Hydrogenedentes bacterium]|nr:prepilin-type N-terminal cleavage/methylation domain-containing protein [Candidatus Hydrogenedentota bacterium]
MPSTPKDKAGFTLVEALLAVVVLALMASVLSGLYLAGLQNLDARDDRMALDSALRSRMEELLSGAFTEIASGSETITVNGASREIVWTVENLDLDGDDSPEVDAKQITVTVGNTSISTVFVDHEGTLAQL